MADGFASDAKIKVVGIPDLQKALKLIDKGLAAELAEGLMEAAEIVRSAAVPLIPERSGDARASVKVRKQGRAAALAVGGSKAPYYGFLDFGNITGQGGAVGRADSVGRPFIKSGRYIYPSLARNRDKVAAKVDEVIERLATKAGFEQEGESVK
jgi:hypothetical protein